MVTTNLMSSPTLQSMTTSLYIPPSAPTTPGSNCRSNVETIKASFKNYNVDVSLILTTNGDVREVSNAVSNVFSTNALLTTVRGPNYAIMYVAAMAPVNLLVCPLATLVLAADVASRDAELPLRWNNFGKTNFNLTWTIIVFFIVNMVSRSYLHCRTSVFMLKKYDRDSVMLNTAMTTVANMVPCSAPASVEPTINRPRTLTGVMHVSFTASFRKQNFTNSRLSKH